MVLPTAEVGIFLFAVAVLAGFIDTLAGGGGLLALPALLICGVPPLYALGTNKLQGSMGTATASILMLRKRRVLWCDVKLLMAAAFIGSTCGTIAVQFIGTEALRLVIPCVLLFIAVYFLFCHSPARGITTAKCTESRYRMLIVPAIGWYDGMFGPGTGSFFALAGVSLRGEELINATARAKTLNFATNISSLIVFVVAGKIIVLLGGLMMVGQMVGAWAGSHFLFRMNPNHLRYLVVLMCTAMLARYLIAL